ncbi:MAG: hypothetical protein R3316_09050 [Rhodovibrionaceae bacterium]|nr:hypothetical protein [Rhodovibrionaceae bacterium]
MNANTKRLLRDFRRSMRSADLHKPNHCLIRAIERISVDADLLLVGATPDIRQRLDAELRAFAARLAENALQHMRQDDSPSVAKGWDAVAAKLALVPCIEAQDTAQRIRAMAERCYVRRTFVKLHATALRSPTNDGFRGWISNESRKLAQAMRCDLPADTQTAA